METLTKQNAQSIVRFSVATETTTLQKLMGSMHDMMYSYEILASIKDRKIKDHVIKCHDLAISFKYVKSGIHYVLWNDDNDLIIVFDSENDFIYTYFKSYSL